MQITLPNGQRLAYDIEGSGPPLLLAHGFPQTRAMWRPHVAQLKNHFTCITPDMRGYGDSPCTGGPEAMTFREMASDIILLMDHLGYQTVHVAGHDRGGRMAHRLTLDHPDRVLSLTLMDIIPTHLLLTEIRADVAKAYNHWFFLAQDGGLPEHFIGTDPDTYFEACLAGWGGPGLEAFDAQLLQTYRQSWRKPATITSMCDDYRAAILYDMHHDAEDLEKKVTCPTLVLYGADGAMAKFYDVGQTWVDRCTTLTARPIPGGHFFPDTNPIETTNALRGFVLNERTPKPATR